MKRFTITITAVGLAILAPSIRCTLINENVEDSEKFIPRITNTLEEGCPKIDNLMEVNLRKFFGTWHLPFMSNHWIKHMSFKVHDKIVKSPVMGSVCVKIHIRPMPENSLISNGNATVWFHTKCPHSSAEFNLACSPNSVENGKWFCTSKDSDDHLEDSWMYVVDSDNATWALVVRCFPQRDIHWAIFSNVKMLETKLLKSIFRKVEQLGFPLYDINEVPYEKCL